MDKHSNRATRTLGALAAMLAIGFFPALAGDGLTIGDSMPELDVAMMGVDGNELSLADAAGEKGTLVIFTCNACPYVKGWEERIARLGNEAASSGIGVIAINSNDPSRNSEDSFEVMKERAEMRGMEFPYVVDETSDVARAFDARVTPEAFLFDASGALVYHGTIDDNVKNPADVMNAYLKDALDAVIAGEEVPVARTKALGCGIKFRSGS